MTRKLVSMKIWATQRVEGRRDAGQGTLEYVGMIVAVAAVVGLAIAGFNSWGLGARVEGVIAKVFP